MVYQVLFCIGIAIVWLLAMRFHIKKDVTEILHKHKAKLDLTRKFFDMNELQFCSELFTAYTCEKYDYVTDFCYIKKGLEHNENNIVGLQDIWKEFILQETKKK
jgi:hypothetical protein